MPRGKARVKKEPGGSIDGDSVENGEGTAAKCESCIICGDRSTGKHYGALSCDGCKGFFRRSVRKKHNYVCRFSGNCIVDRDHRNTCRRCRFERCIARGMKKEAVQAERDTITQMEPSTVSASTSTPPTTGHTAVATLLSKRSCEPSGENSPTSVGSNGLIHLSNSSTAHLDRILEAEAALRSLRSSVITKTSDARKTATTCDATESMHQQLLLLVEWAKKLDSFCSLSMSVQVSLLRAYAAQHLVLCAAYKSTHLSDSLLLTNGTCLPKKSNIPDVNRVADRIIETLTVMMRRLAIRGFEYVALKGIAFFDPLACPDTVPEDIAKVEEIRSHLLQSLEARMTSEVPNPSQRVFSLLLLLPPLVAVSRDLIEDVQLAKLFGLADIDFLMTELLIPGAAT